MPLGPAYHALMARAAAPAQAPILPVTATTTTSVALTAFTAGPAFLAPLAFSSRGQRQMYQQQQHHHQLQYRAVTPFRRTQEKKEATGPLSFSPGSRRRSKHHPRALLSMSSSDSSGGGGSGSEVPEATRKLLEQAAKARAEVRT